MQQMQPERNKKLIKYAFFAIKVDKCIFVGNKMWLLYFACNIAARNVAVTTMNMCNCIAYISYVKYFPAHLYTNLYIYLCAYAYIYA